MSGKQDRRRRREQRGGPQARDAGAGASAREQYQARVSRILGGQLAPQGPQGVRILMRCPECGRAWLQDPGAPHGVRLFLADAELAALADELHADLGRLPYATCRACSATRGAGEFNIDEYGRGAGGYGLSWEGADPPGGHILLSVLSEEWAYSVRAGPPPRAGVVTRFGHLRAVLRWLAELRAPATYRALDAEDSRAMSETSTPGHGAPGTDGWVWRGAFWRATCPPLGGPARVNLSQAMPPNEPYSLSVTVATVRRLAEIVLAGHVAGETLGDEGAPDA